jgi:hypothetical protein
LSEKCLSVKNPAAERESALKIFQRYITKSDLAALVAAATAAQTAADATAEQPGLV